MKEEREGWRDRGKEEGESKGAKEENEGWRGRETGVVRKWRRTKVNHYVYNFISHR